jgi:hypothetical protein
VMASIRTEPTNSSTCWEVTHERQGVSVGPRDATMEGLLGEVFSTLSAVRENSQVFTVVCQLSC